MGADLRIEADGPTGAQIWLDGQDISKFTSSVELEVTVGEVHRATLHVFVDHLELGLNADVQINVPVLRKDVVE